LLEGSITQHAITTGQEITPEQIRISQPVNVSGNKQLRGEATFGFPVNQIKSRLSFTGNAFYENGTTVLNGEAQNIRQDRIGGRFRYDYRLDEIVEFSFSANVAYQTTGYEFEHVSDQKYLNQTYRTEGSLSFLKNYQVNASFDFLVYENKSMDFSTEIPLLNVSASRFVLKNKSGEIKISGVNMLNKNLGINQTSNVNYQERTTSNSLGRYLMVSFTYALNKQLNPMSMRRGGRGMRIIR
jgi:hypothetical protein